MQNDTITAIEGLCVGHAALPDAMSGCTVILPECGGTAGVDIRGGAPGTFGTDTLNPLNLVERVDGIFLTGGSAFGLAVADGVREHLHGKNVGFDSGYGVVPIISGAVIFDLGINAGRPRPGAELGRAACEAASREVVAEGCVGAGVGATVGKLYGLARSMKAGLGSACIEAPSGIKVGALMVVNAFGDIFDPALGRTIAGCRASEESLDLLNADGALRQFKRLKGFPSSCNNTLIGVVATNAKFNKTQLTKVAQMAHDGLARTVYPAHTQYDGDTIFAVSCGNLEDAEVTIVGALAAQATAEAILRAVYKADSLGGIPSWKDLAAASASAIQTPD
ncbi:MAG: P1 family peptidase [Syntrophobacteraceae bacterium]